MSKHIPLTRGCVAIVDDEDFEWLSAYPWHAYPNNSGIYAVRTVHAETSYKVRMHREILGLGKEDRRIGDHINGNTLDNRRCNLRIVTQQRNCMNKHKPSSTESGVYGVIRVKAKWRASIEVNGCAYYLGEFDSIGDAITARRAAELKHYGEYTQEHAALDGLLENIARSQEARHG